MINYIEIYKSLVEKFNLPEQKRIIESKHIDCLLETKEFHIAKTTLPEVRNLTMDCFPQFQYIIEQYGLKIKHMIVSDEIMRKVKDLVADKYVTFDASVSFPCVLFGIEIYVSGDIGSNQIYFLCEGEYVLLSQTLIEIWRAFKLGNNWNYTKEVKYGNDMINIRQFKNCSIVPEPPL